MGTIFLSLLLFGVVWLAPSESSLVVSSTESSANIDGRESSGTETVPSFPIIYEMSITSNVSNRFAKTLITSKVKNTQKSAKETAFTVVLPQKAFISEFVMEIGGKAYKAYVKEKEEAKQTYNKAVASGQSAGYVAVSARDSNKFTVSINVEPESKVVFLLTYEELLERKNDQYELIINIHPGQIVKDLNVKVYINESRPLRFVKTPSLRSGNEINKNDDQLNPYTDIEIMNSTAVIQFTPDVEKQRQFARLLNAKESSGLSGQFVVQYDVERDPYGGEVLLQDGYFVHFFAPNDLKPLPKHVLFVLDSSGSMSGRKIEQLKNALHEILKEIQEGDLLSILNFDDDVQVWNIERETKTYVPTNYNDDYRELTRFQEMDLPSASTINNVTLTKVKRVIDDLGAFGSTNIILALQTALYLAKQVQNNQNEIKYQPLIIFLTDGEPNVDISQTSKITELITKLNSANNNVPIFSLSFGDGADREFLKEISLKNLGFSRFIYEASDASLQLQEFYKQISSPLLSNIKFKYNNKVSQVTKTKFPIFFRGSEIVVTGKYEGSDSSFIRPVNCWSQVGLKRLVPVVHQPVSSLERLWAYLTVKQTLDERKISHHKNDSSKKALDLALKYSFVTEVTSLVVVKPNETNSVDTVDASKIRGIGPYFPRPYHAPTVVSRVAYGPPPSGISRVAYGPPPSGISWVSFGPAPSGIGTPSYFFPPSRSSNLHSIGLNRGSVAIPRIPYHRPLYNARTHTGWFSPQLSAPSTTPSSTTTAPSTTSVPNFIVRLPWLSSVMNTNGTLTVGQNVYQFGDNSTSLVGTSCHGTPTNSTGTGTCVLLSNCPEVYPLLTSFSEYRKYFCSPNNTYVGVCCPLKTTINP